LFRIFFSSLLALLLSGLGAGCSSGQPPEESAGEVTAMPPEVPASLARFTGTAASGSGSGAVTAGDLLVEISGSGVVIIASNVSLEAVLYNLAERADFELVTTMDDWDDVSQTIQAVNLHTALVELLKQHPYQIIYEYDHDNQADSLKRVVVGDPPVSRERALAAAAGDYTVTTDIRSYGMLPGAMEATMPEEERAYLNQLLDPSAEVREEAAEHIKPTGIALDYLTTVITTDPSPDVRIAAAYTLQGSKDPKALDALIMALQDNHPEVLVEVIEVLPSLENRRVVPYLMPFLDHPDEEVRNSAEETINLLN
jgi:hypothetical protein